MEIRQCNRCKKVVDSESEIGVVVDISRFRVTRGYIRPSRLLREAANTEYFPLMFTEQFGGEIDLCDQCFAAFMKLGFVMTVLPPDNL